MKLSLGLIAVLSATAYADEDHSKDEDQAFITAIQRHDAKALAAMVDVPFALANVPFKTADCKKKLGGRNAVAKDAKQLVACLAQVKVADGGFHKWDDKVDGTLCTSNAMIGGYDTTIVLQLAAGHPYKVTSLAMKEMEGEVGGVAGGYQPLCTGKNDLPPPPPPPPPAPPQNVAPTALEPLRTHGNSKIPPNQFAKQEIDKSGKAKLVGSWKLCVDTTGKPSLVSLLKSTGVPVYDAQVKATIEVEWEFKPFLVSGKPVPVCTAVTFIYGT